MRIFLALNVSLSKNEWIQHVVKIFYVSADKELGK